MSLGRQLVQRPTTERREHVQVDVAPVRVVGAVRSFDCWTGSHRASQVLAQVSFSVATGSPVVLACESDLRATARRRLRRGPRRDPAAALLLARARIDAVVDDGVVVLALLLDASAHGALLRIGSERDATQQLRRPDPRRPTGIAALPGSTATPTRSNASEGRRVDPSSPEDPAGCPKRASARPSDAATGGRLVACRLGPARHQLPVPVPALKSVEKGRRSGPENGQQKGPPRFPERASDLLFQMVAGAGFEPATFGL
jgi:hypothetical protein